MVAEFLGKRLADRDQVFAGIEAFGDLAGALAERLTIADMRGPGEHIDLTTRIVDVVFAGNCVPGRGEQAGKRIAHHRAPAMAHMHRPGRVGGNIFHVYPRALRDAQVDEARPGNLRALDIRIAAQVLDDLFGQRARIGARRLGQHHRGVGGNIAVCRIARRLHRDIGARSTGGQSALHLQRGEHGIDPLCKRGVNCVVIRHARPLTRFRAARKGEQAGYGLPATSISAWRCRPAGLR